MSFAKQIFNQFHARFFESVVNNRLVYNSCWEDPYIDRQLLQLNKQSEVVMLTSAGCNALDYLLDSPASIHCVDTNPAQNALLELKKALFVGGNYSTLWRFFGRGHHRTAQVVYHRELRPCLSDKARQFWDHHIDYFSPSSPKPSFYFRGTSGTVAHIIQRRIRHKGLCEDVLNLLDSKSLQEQQYYFDVIEPHLWNAFSRWLFNRSATMAMLGVPRSQSAIIDKETEGGLPSFIHRSLLNIFTGRPLGNNYFWRVYLTGSYTKACCPNYLKENHFDSIRAKSDRITLSDGSIIKFLKRRPGPYSHFILLDHQDWLAYKHPQKLDEEWKLLLSNAKPGTKILFRSAGIGRSFLPSFTNHHLSFEDKKTRQLHNNDRVGTYGSTHLATVTATL